MQWLASLPFLIPSVGTPEWPLFFGEWLAFVVLGLMLWQMKERIEWQKLLDLTWTVLGLVIILLIQIILNLSTTVMSRHFLGILYLSAFALTIYLGKNTKIELPAFLMAIFLSSIILAMTGFIQYFNPNLPIVIELAIPIPGMQGWLGQRNLFNNYVFCGVIACIWLGLEKRINGFVAGLSLCFLLLACVLSGSRTIWLYLALLIVLIKIDRRIWLICGLLMTVILIAEIGMKDSIVMRQENLSNLLENPRLIMLQNALQMFLNHPLLGFGFGEYTYGVYELSSNTSRLIIERHSHNLVMQVLAETGLIGFFLLIMMFNNWFRLMWLVRRKELWPIYMIIAVQLIHSMVEFPLWHSQWLFLFGLCIGIGIGVADKNGNK